MKRVLLFQLDGKLPNLALMRIARVYPQAELVRVKRPADIQPDLWGHADLVFASAIFTSSRRLVGQVLQTYPQAIVGGTGVSLKRTLADYGIYERTPNYGIYPTYYHSIGFTQRGCRRKCPFCVVPQKEGDVRPDSTIAEIWRGPGHAKNILLLDNDFFGQRHWRDRIYELHDGDFKVSFNQGINARNLTDEAAQAISTVRYYDDNFRSRRIYTAWDSKRDEGALFRGLESLVKYGVKPDHIMVYMLIGYWPGETTEDWEYRRRALRTFGCRPYPMPYERNRLTVGFQRWVVGAYDKRVPWDEWQRAGYEPRNLTRAGAFG